MIDKILTEDYVNEPHIRELTPKCQICASCVSNKNKFDVINTSGNGNGNGPLDFCC